MKTLSFVNRNIRRTPYQAIAATLVMFLTFLTLLLFMAVALGSQRILQYYESKPQAIAFFKDGTSQDDVNAIQNMLNQTGKVTGLNYVSKEQALEIYRERNKSNPALLELVTANILPASLEISTATPQDLAPIAEVLKKEPIIEEVVVPEDVIQTLTNATSVIRSIGLVVVTLLILFAFFLLLMVIGFKIRIKRSEIEIMKLLGASSWFIRVPFILEGIAYGVAGAVLAWLVCAGLLWYFTPYLQEYLQGIPSSVITLPIPLEILAYFFGVVLLASIIISSLGSYSAVRRYLKI